MYLHIGNDYVLRDKYVVGVFDIENTSVSKDTRAFLAEAEKRGEVVNAAPDLPKTFVVTEQSGDRQVWLAPVSAATITKRARSRAL